MMVDGQPCPSPHDLPTHSARKCRLLRIVELVTVCRMSRYTSTLEKIHWKSQFKIRWRLYSNTERIIMLLTFSAVTNSQVVYINRIVNVPVGKLFKFYINSAFYMTSLNHGSVVKLHCELTILLGEAAT